MANRAVQFGLLTASGVLIYSGFKGLSIIETLAGSVGATLDPRGARIAERLRNVPPGSPDELVQTAEVGCVRYKGRRVAGWIVPVLRHAERNGWRGTVTSGYRSPDEQRRVCREICGNPNGCPGRCAAPGASEHQYCTFPRGAVDVSNPAQFARAIANYPGGPPLRNALGSEDPFHFSASGV